MRGAASHHDSSGGAFQPAVSASYSPAKSPPWLQLRVQRFYLLVAKTEWRHTSPVTFSRGAGELERDEPAPSGDAPSGRPRRRALHRQTLSRPCTGSAPTRESGTILLCKAAEEGPRRLRSSLAVLFVQLHQELVGAAQLAVMPLSRAAAGRAAVSDPMQRQEKILSLSCHC